MPSLRRILTDGQAVADGAIRYAIPPEWQQGRTAFGGLSSAIALDAAQRSLPGLPPLRSAMISFVGPLTGAVTASVRELRRGRNACFVHVDLTGDAGPGLSAGFVFVAARPSQIDQPAAPSPAIGPPGSERRVNPPASVAFLQNFDVTENRASPEGVEWLRWVRLSDRDGLDPMVEMLAVGDALPPAAMRLAGGPAPISSMTWQCNLLTDEPRTEDGWWLLHARSDAARDGCSSQSMGIWNAAGHRIASGMQSIALFV